MKKIILFLFLLCTTASFAVEKRMSVQVTNPLKIERKDVPVVVRINSSSIGFDVQSAVVKDKGKEISSQLDDLNGDRKADELAFVADLKPNESKSFTVEFSSEKSNKKYTSRVYSDMLISDKDGKHVPITSLTIPGTSNVYNNLHHHGPDFESEMVGYRIYFDKKQTVDIYGKFHKGLELEACGFYPNDAQLAKGFGDDVLWVGSSCGLGTLKGWNGKEATHIEPVALRTERVIAKGPVRTIVEVEDVDWQYQNSTLNMTTRYTLYAGHRDANVIVTFKEPLKKETFATGVINIKGSTSFSDHKGLIACWGTDWPVTDTVKYAKETVGLAVSIPEKLIKTETKDKMNYLYTLGAENEKSFSYDITFTSMKETFGYKNSQAWFDYVKQWKNELLNPCTVFVLASSKASISRRRK